jgi:hypothetical protein
MQFVRCMSPFMARTGPTAMSAVLPLLGDERKRPEWLILVAIDPKPSWVSGYIHLLEIAENLVPVWMDCDNSRWDNADVGGPPDDVWPFKGERSLDKDCVLRTHGAGTV